MSAYATPRLELATYTFCRQSNQTDPTTSSDSVGPSSLIDALIDQLAQRVAERLATTGASLQTSEPNGQDEWFDSRHAADYLGVHRDRLRKLAAERAIPSEQDGPGCKLYFRRADLDTWRRAGGRPRHLQASLASVA